MADQVASANFDLVKFITRRVTWSGEGTLVFDPPLANPAKLGVNSFTVSVAGAESPPAPLKVSFRVTGLARNIEVSSMSFVHGEVDDLVAAIRKQVKFRGEGEALIELTSGTALDKPNKHQFRVHVPSQGLYAAETKEKVHVTVTKMPSRITVGTVDSQPYLDKGIARTIRKAVTVEEGVAGKLNERLVFSPGLDSELQPGTHDIRVHLPEDDFYLESPEGVITVEIDATSHFKVQVFNEWEQLNRAMIDANPHWKKNIDGKKYDIQHGKAGGNSRAEIISALNETIGVPSRLIVWKALGHELKSNQWVMPQKWTTASGKVFHLTVSADSIMVPGTWADWKAAPSALFDTLFMSPAVARRVHLTLEEGSRHLFLGNLSGTGTAVQDSWWDGHAAEMKPRLLEFKTDMIDKLQAFKTANQAIIDAS